MPFFDYRQNNSGGWFRGPAVNVIIEADDAEDANSRAEEIGLYWDGVWAGQDCECCGDRWSKASKSDKGDPVPSLYGQPIDDFSNAVVYYKDGTVKGEEQNGKF